MYFNHVFNVNLTVDINSYHEDGYDCTQMDKHWLRERIQDALDECDDLSNICDLSETVEHKNESV